METLKRLIREDDGMEMIEWAIVGVVFAVAAAAFWGAALGGSAAWTFVIVTDIPKAHKQAATSIRIGHEDRI